MISTFKQNKITWIDLERPTADEVKSLMQKYSIHPLIAEELLKPTIRAKIDVYKNTIFFVMHFPIFEHDRKISVSYEMDFIIGKNFLITVHYKSIAPLYEIIKIFEVGSLLGKENLSKNPGVLLFFIIKQFYEFSLRQMDHIQLRIDKIEENIFKGREKEMVEAISYARCDILDFQKSIHMHESVLRSLEDAGKKFFGSDFIYYANSMLADLVKIKNQLTFLKETVESLQSTNDSLLTDRVNNIMKTLSALAFITFPMMLFTAIFSMNTISTPILGIKGDFWIIASMMLTAIIIMVIIFKRKKWL